MRIKSLLLSAVMIAFLVTGCASSVVPCTPTVITKYQTVEIPVTYALKRPDRPLLDDKTLPVYIKELTSYTETLEMIIDYSNKKD